MARLSLLPTDEFDEETKQALGEESLADPARLGLLRVLARRADLTHAFLTYRRDLAADTALSPRLLELVRLRVAFHNQCRSCMALRGASGVEDGLTEDVVCQIAAPDEAPDLTPSEKAALQYADLLATDHLSADDRVFDRLREHFSELEIIDLGVHLAVFVGFGRLSATWDIVDDLPERFQDRDAAVTPWGDDVAVAGHR